MLTLNDIVKELLPADAANIIYSANQSGALSIDEAVKKEKLTYEQIARHIAERCQLQFSSSIQGELLSVSPDNLVITTTIGRYAWGPFYLGDYSGLIVVPKDVFDHRGVKRSEKDDVPTEGTIQRLCDTILDAAIAKKATDIHIDPEENAWAVHFRIDGVKRQFRQISLGEGDKLSKFIVMKCNETSNVKVDEKRLPQDGRLVHNGINLRLGFEPTLYGYKVTIRLLTRLATSDTFESLGFLPLSQKILQTYLQKTYGLIIFTGPTGSGKSRTQSVCLKTINRDEKNVLTIEDPVEYPVYGCNQSQVELWKNEAGDVVGFTFAIATKHFLRHDPDVIMIGEVRDKETAQTTVESAITGHLVFATTHATFTSMVPLRFLAHPLEVDKFSLASSLMLVIGQRLVKKLCPHCRRQTPLDLEDLKPFYVDDRTPFDGMVGELIYRANPSGCDQCEKGFLGRTVVEEILVMSDDARQIIIADGGNPLALQKHVKLSFNDAIRQKSLRGDVDIVQVHTVIN